MGCDFHSLSPATHGESPPTGLPLFFQLPSRVFCTSCPAKRHESVYFVASCDSCPHRLESQSKHIAPLIWLPYDGCVTKAQRRQGRKTKTQTPGGIWKGLLKEVCRFCKQEQLARGDQCGKVLPGTGNRRTMGERGREPFFWILDPSSSQILVNEETF